MSGFCLLVELHWEGSALQPAQRSRLVLPCQLYIQLILIVYARARFAIDSFLVILEMFVLGVNLVIFRPVNSFPCDNSWALSVTAGGSCWQCLAVCVARRSARRHLTRHGGRGARRVRTTDYRAATTLG